MTALALRPRLLRLLLPLLVLAFTAVSGSALAGPKPASGQFLTAGTLIGAQPLQDATLHQAVWKISPKPAAGCCVAAEGVVDSGAASSLQGFRLSQQLAAEEAAGASAPTSITNYSTHALDQIVGRDGGIGVSQSALEDAYANPNAIQYAPSAYGPTFRFVGNDATVVVNPQGNVVTGWATSRAGVGP